MNRGREAVGGKNVTKKSSRFSYIHNTAFICPSFMCSKEREKNAKIKKKKKNPPASDPQECLLHAADLSLTTTGMLT